MMTPEEQALLNRLTEARDRWLAAWEGERMLCIFWQKRASEVEANRDALRIREMNADFSKALMDEMRESNTRLLGILADIEGLAEQAFHEGWTEGIASTRGERSYYPSSNPWKSSATRATLVKRLGAYAE